MMGQLGSVAALAGKELGLKNPSDAYVLVLKSNAIGEKLIRRFDLMRLYKKKNLVDTLKALASHTKISDDKSGVITIEFADKDPKRAADIANGYVDAAAPGEDRREADQALAAPGRLHWRASGRALQG